MNVCSIGLEHAPVCQSMFRKLKSPSRIMFSFRVSLMDLMIRVAHAKIHSTLVCGWTWIHRSSASASHSVYLVAFSSDFTISSIHSHLPPPPPPLSLLYLFSESEMETSSQQISVMATSGFWSSLMSFRRAYLDASPCALRYNTDRGRCSLPRLTTVGG